MFPLLLVACSSATWAVLLAGSHTYDNYRHQADMFRMYSTLIRRGIPAKNIVLLAYNDVIDDPLNPRKGKIYSEIGGPNIYPGDQFVDFQGEEVNAENVKNVLLGRSYGGKKVLQTGKDDDILFFFNNHGAHALLSMPTAPNSQERFLFGEEIRDIFLQMRSENKFHRLLFVIEACESGSVGQLINMQNVLTLTASTSEQPSHAAKFDSELGTFLTNEFTNAFFEFIDRHDDALIYDLFNYVKQHTSSSSVKSYGDSTIFALNMSTFFGKGNGLMRPPPRPNELVVDAENAAAARFLLKMQNAPSKSIPSLRHSYDDELSRQVNEEIRFQTIFDRLIKSQNKQHSLFAIDNSQNGLNLDQDCYKTVVEDAALLCGTPDATALSWMKNFSEICETMSVNDIVTEMGKVCSPRNSTGLCQEAIISHFSHCPTQNAARTEAMRHCGTAAHMQNAAQLAEQSCPSSSFLSQPVDSAEMARCKKGFNSFFSARPNGDALKMHFSSNLAGLCNYLSAPLVLVIAEHLDSNFSRPVTFQNLGSFVEAKAVGSKISEKNVSQLSATEIVKCDVEDLCPAKHGELTKKEKRRAVKLCKAEKYGELADLIGEKCFGMCGSGLKRYENRCNQETLSDLKKRCPGNTTKVLEEAGLACLTTENLRKCLLRTGETIRENMTRWEAKQIVMRCATHIENCEDKLDRYRETICPDQQPVLFQALKSKCDASTFKELSAAAREEFCF